LSEKSYFFGKVEYICGTTGIIKKKWGNGIMEYWNKGMTWRKHIGITE
jgi:hypothetical protein